MDLNYAMSYRITTLEIEQAAIRAERARMAAEHGDQIVRSEGLVRRALRAIAARRAASRTAAAPVRTPAQAPADQTPLAEVVPEAAPADVPAGELVGCAPHTA